MKPQDQSRFDYGRRTTDAGISRRAAVGSSGLAILGLLSGSVFGQEKKEPERKEAEAKSRKDGQERMEQFKAFSKRMSNASPEERMKIMEERRVQEHQRAIEDFKDRLGVSDKEWPVIKPRVEKVYNMVHPLPQMRPGNEQAKTEVEHRSNELRELLHKEGTGADQIKAKLTALRAAKERAAQELATAKQSLRQLMTLRQEAEMVLSGLLD
jgi:DNA repair exonuclease SbcCD ATPase subunit